MTDDFDGRNLFTALYRMEYPDTDVLTSQCPQGHEREIPSCHQVNVTILKPLKLHHITH